MESAILSALLRKSRSAAKAVALPTLLAAGTAGVAAFAPPAAHAVITTKTFSCIAGVTCVPGVTQHQHGDKNVTFLGFDVFTAPPVVSPPVATQVEYSWTFDSANPLDYSGDVWKVEVRPAVGSFIGPFDIQFSYSIDIVDGPGFDDNGIAFDGTNWAFNDFQLGTDGTRDRTLTFKTVTADTGEILDFECIVQSASGGGCDGLKPLLATAKTVTVTDRVRMLQGPPSTLTSVSNSWTQKPVQQVPGPLPILGAGVAFGYSRKLRKRITNTLSA